MNRIEQTVHQLVRNNPRLKRLLRNLYQDIASLVPAQKFESPYPIQTRPYSFFGFHDKSPFSPDNKALLAHHTQLPPKMPRAGQMIDIGLYRGEEWMEYEKLADTGAWNWHQGAMLQWLGNSGNLIFNDYRGKIHFSRILDQQGKEISRQDHPVAAVSPDGIHAVSYDFVRSDRGMPGYGYPHGLDPEGGALSGKRTGIHLLNLETGEFRTICTLYDLAENKPLPSMDNAFHWVTHCQFSPDGKHFKFFHRWVHERTRTHFTRMYSVDLATGSLYLYNTDGMVSHVAWRDPEHLIAWARTHEHGTGYHLFTVNSATTQPVGMHCFRDDGHPSFSNDGRWMLTDTYPDRRRLQTLILFDSHEEVRYDIARFFHPRAFVGRIVEQRIEVDLHPRWSRDNRTICVDSAYTGVRSLVTFHIGELEADKIETVHNPCQV